MFPRFNIPRWFLFHMPRCFQVSTKGDHYYPVHISSGCGEEHDNFYSETTYFDCTDPCFAQATSDGQKRVSKPESNWRKKWIACILGLYLSLYWVQCCFTIHVYVPVVILLRWFSTSSRLFYTFSMSLHVRIYIYILCYCCDMLGF